MMRILRNRVLVARAATITITACGTVAGYFLGCALALQLAENWLDQYAMVTVQQSDASFAEARSLLTVLKASPYSFCSESEISYFREMVFRSEYLKDAGRIRGGKIECSATSDRPARTNVQFDADSKQNDGMIAYSNLLPFRDAHLKRTGLQMGTAYVVLGSHLPSGSGPIPMQLAISGSDAGGQQGSDAAAATVAGNQAPASPEGTRRVGDMLYATRCSTLRISCATSSTPVSEVMHDESSTISGCAVVGALSGVLLGMAFSFVHGRSRDQCQQLRRAIARDQLEVVYQPIVDLAGGRIVGAEALARWTDEDGNDVEPDVFVKIAEEHGFVGSITKAVVRRALHDFSETLRNRTDFRLSVNVAAADLSDPGFLPMLDDSLKHAKVKSRSLVIEITERSTASGDEAMETIRNLRRQGHSIHIDDFGTGYSNLDKLLYLFADTIKIDKAFTKVIGTDAVTVAILPQILAMAQSLNLDVVVEGVENDRQADYFSPSKQKLFGQGWLYGRPATAEEFHCLLADDWSKMLAAQDSVTPWPSKVHALRIVDSRTA